MESFFSSILISTIGDSELDFEDSGLGFGVEETEEELELLVCWLAWLLYWPKIPENRENAPFPTTSTIFSN